MLSREFFDRTFGDKTWVSKQTLVTEFFDIISALKSWIRLREDLWWSVGKVGKEKWVSINSKTDGKCGQE